MKKILPVLFLLVFFGWLLVYFDRFEEKPFQNQEEKIKIGMHANRIFQPDLVMHFPSESKVEIFQGKQVLGGVVPHHLVAASSLAEFFSALSKSSVPPRTIIIIGPNHEEKGRGQIITGKYSWETSFGVLESDVGLVDDLVRNKIAVLDDELLSSEHAIYSLTPFVKYFLPDSKIVPLVLSAKLSQDEATELGKKIAQITKGGVIAVGSIDFSHYLSLEISNQKDQETLSAIEKKDYRLLESYNNDHLDSPDALLAVMSFVGEKSREKYFLEIIRHTNSGSILDKENALGTSHFELGFVLEE